MECSHPSAIALYISFISLLYFPLLPLNQEWSSSAGFKAQLAPMFKSPDGKLISVAAVAYLATMASKSSSKAAHEAAKKLLLEEVRVHLRKRAEKASIKQHKKTMAEFVRAKEDLTGSFGGPNTMYACQRNWLTYIFFH